MTCASACRPLGYTRQILCAALLAAIAANSGCSLVFSEKPSAADASVSGADATAFMPPSGTYAIQWDVVAGCTTATFAADRLRVTTASLTFASQACETFTNVAVGYSARGASSIRVAESVLWNCEETIRYEVSPFELVFSGEMISAEVQADQIIPPQTAVICTGDFALTGERIP